MSPALELFFHNFGWMRWNLFLAVIPFVLSIILFRNRARRNLWWWIGLLPFILFLPNAAYTVTDIIHFVSDSREPELSQNGIIFVIIPQYIIFLLLGFQCHVLSLMRMGHYLRNHNLIRNLVPVELAFNLLCAFGVYLGRVNRLNSWHLFTKPDRLFEDVINNLDERSFFFGTMIFFVAITLLYYPFKLVNASIASKWRSPKLD
jgi:uncharacterized membrane protein